MFSSFSNSPVRTPLTSTVDAWEHSQCSKYPDQEHIAYNQGTLLVIEHHCIPSCSSLKWTLQANIQWWSSQCRIWSNFWSGKGVGLEQTWSKRNCASAQVWSKQIGIWDHSEQYRRGRHGHIMIRIVISEINAPAYALSPVPHLERRAFRKKNA